MTLQIVVGDPLDESPGRITADLAEQPHLSVYGGPDKVRVGILDAFAFQFLMAEGEVWAAAPDKDLSVIKTLPFLQRPDYGVRNSGRGVEKLHALTKKRQKGASPSGGWWGRMFHGDSAPLLMLLTDVGWEDPALAGSRSMLTRIADEGPGVNVHLLVHGAVPGVLADQLADHLADRGGRIELCGKFHQPHTWRPRVGPDMQFEFTGHEAVEMGAILRKRFPSNGYV